MHTHTVLVKTQRPDGGFWEPGERIAYDGPVNWKFEPLDRAAHADWETVADPERVADENRRTAVAGYFGEEDPYPDGMWAN